MIADPRTLALIEELRGLPDETQWVEFKHNNEDPEMIGKYVSALSNAARLHDQHFAYVVWGIKDGSHATLGSDFSPASKKVKGQPFEFWLAKNLRPSVSFEFKQVDHPEGRLILLEIPAATSSPVEFEKTAYIRIGSATPKLSDFPERLKALWSKLQPYAWESGVAAQFQTGDEVLKKIDYASYFELTQKPLPDNRNGIFERLEADQIIVKDVSKRWNITHLGAILFAQDIHAFNSAINRKAVRFVAYKGKSRADQVIHRFDSGKGYANGFKALIDYIHGLLPKNEHIGKAFRKETPLYPAIAIRELIANALIHQDMTIRGAGPLIELFVDRMEITNPGIPLVRVERFIDTPPRSRNEALAALMRRMRLCEEQGTGIDKVIINIELYHLPPPDFRAEEEATRAFLFAPRSFAEMTVEERLRACYQHSVIRYLSQDPMKNATLCERLGIEQHNRAQASKVIKSALDQGLIKPQNQENPRAGYVPIWA